MKKISISIFEMVTLVALIFAPLSLLFVQGDLLFPYITSKNYIWRYAIDVAFIAWAALALLDVRYRINIRNPIFVTFSLFMVAMLVANMTGIDPHRSFWSNSERMDGYIGLLHIYGFFIVLLGFVKAQVENTQLYNYITVGLFTVTIGGIYESTISKTMSTTGSPDESSVGFFLMSLVLMGIVFIGSWHRPTLLKTILHGLLSLGVLFGIMAILQNKIRADAILGNPIYLASYVSFCVFISAYFLVARERLFNKKYLKELLYGFLILFFIAIIFETSTRGAVLGLLFGGLTTSILFALTCKSQEEKKWRIIGATTAVGIILSVGGFFIAKDTISNSDYFSDGSLISRAANFNLEDTTTKHRITNWEMALEGVAERPLFGWGQESYIHVFSRYYRADELYDAEQWFDRTHNMFLDWLLFGGIIGLVTFLILLGSGFYVIWKKTGDTFSHLQKSILSGIIVAYMAQNFVAFDSLATGLWIALILAMIALANENKTETKEIVVKDSIAALAIVSLLVGLCIWLSISYYQPRAATKSFIELLRPAPTGQTLQEASVQRLESLKKNYSNNTFVNQEILEQLLSKPQLYVRQGIDQETQLEYLNFVTLNTENELEQKPYLTRLQIFYGSLLQNLSQQDKAQTYLKAAVDQSPEKIQFLWTLGKNQIELGKTQEGLGYLKEALNLAPEFKPSQDVYNSYLIQTTK